MRGVTRKMPSRPAWARFAVRAAALSAVLVTVSVQQAAAQTYVVGVTTPALPAGGTMGGFEPLQSPPDGRVVGCSSGTCVAVGNYGDESLNSFPFLTPFADGTPAASTAVTMPANADATYESGFQDLSCWSTGSCVGVGMYGDTNDDEIAMVVPINAGKPGTVSVPTLPSNANTTNGITQLNGVSCWSGGSCIAVGSYYTATPENQALVVPVTGGVAGAGVSVTLPANANTAGNQAADLYDVACWSAGSCVAVGTYYDTADNEQAMVVPITGGVAQPATEVTLPTGAAGSSYPFLDSVGCTSSGSCFAVGYYTDNAGDSEALAVPIASGTVGTASEVALPANAAGNSGGQNAGLQSVSCPPSGECEAVGYYADGSTAIQALAIPLGSGTAGAEVVAPANPTGGITQDAGLSGVSCLAGGACVAVGTYSDANDAAQGMIVPITSAGVGTAAQVAPASEVASSGFASLLDAISCDTSGSCAAGGAYSNASGDDVPYEVNVEASLAASGTGLSPGTVASAYQQTLSATGAWGAYSWSVSSGSLPAGLSLNAQTGVISGRPTAAGTSNFTMQVSGAGLPAQTATEALSITIAALPPHLTVSGGRLQVKSNRLKVKLGCSGSTCNGTVKLDATEVLTVEHGKKRVKKHRTVMIGSAHFSVAAGHSASTTITLNKTGRRLLAAAKGHKLAVKVLAAASGGNSASHSATIWMKVAKKKRKG
jgi:mRNA-degrading endonuclease toxin of MazEF toxin-antitoxin module